MRVIEVVKRPGGEEAMKVSSNSGEESASVGTESRLSHFERRLRAGKL